MEKINSKMNEKKESTLNDGKNQPQMSEKK